MVSPTFTKFCGRASAAWDLCKKKSSSPLATKKSRFCGRPPSWWDRFTAALFCKKQQSSGSSPSFHEVLQQCVSDSHTPCFCKKSVLFFLLVKILLCVQCRGGRGGFFFWPTRSKKRCTWRRHLYLGASIRPKYLVKSVPTYLGASVQNIWWNLFQHIWEHPSVQNI